MSQAVRKREAFLELIRIAACFLVIVNHTVSGLFMGKSPAETTWFLAVAYFFVSKPAVPLFFMVSGYLLLGRRDSWRTVWNRISRILIVLLCCAGIYAVFYTITGETEGIWKEFLNVYKMPPSNALWYLYTYLGLLLMLPFLQKMAAGMEKTDYWVLLGITAVVEGVIPLLNHYDERIFLIWLLELPLFSDVIFMFFAGHYFARFGVKRSGKGFAAAALLIVTAVLLETAGTYWEFQITEGGDYLFFDKRSLLPNLVASLGLFYLASFASFPGWLEKGVVCVGRCTFGMYLIGDMLLEIFSPAYKMLQGMTHSLIALVLYEVLVFAAAFCIIWPLRRIPWVRKIL